MTRNQTERPRAKKRGVHRTLLPPTLAPIGLSRQDAAAYIGVSPTKFDEMVADGRMPGPKHIDGRRVWYRPMIEAAFADLPGDCEDQADIWSKMSV